ncbi:unnamed protein product, partial [Prorocentrum cordatum]
GWGSHVAPQNFLERCSVLLGGLGRGGGPPSDQSSATVQRRVGLRDAPEIISTRRSSLVGLRPEELQATFTRVQKGPVSAFLCGGQSASEQLGTAGATREAERVSKWMLVLPPSQNWLSVLGVNKGLTGLAKDFVINYLGRSAYHDKNGKLIDNIKSVSTAFPRSNNVDDYAIKAIQSAVLKVCREGKNLFSDDGSLHLMLSELEDVLLLFLLPLSPSCLLLPAGLLPTPFSILPSPLPSSFRSFYFPRPSEWSFPPVPLLSSRTLSRIPPSCRTSRPP